jgi:energy-coupling factor transporter ATP-binding protein EcfA2
MSQALSLFRHRRPGRDETGDDPDRRSIPGIGGVLVFGDRGTGKSTAVRALAALLPPIQAVEGCPVNAAARGCARLGECHLHQAVVERPTPVIDLPLGVTEDRVVGALDIEARADTGRKGVRAGPAGAGQSRVSLYRRGQPAGGSHRRSAARRGAIGRERGRARGAVDPPSRALRAGGLRQPRRGRAAARSCWTGSACRSRCARPRYRRADRGDPPPRRLRPRPAGLHAPLADRGRQASRRRSLTARGAAGETCDARRRAARLCASCASRLARTVCAGN